jgi:hypothetical protein
LEALWTLHQLEHDPVMDANILGELSGDHVPALRSWSARLLGERFVSSLQIPKKDRQYDLVERLASLMSDPDPTVRFSATTALRQWNSRWLTVDRGLWSTIGVKFGESKTLTSDEAVSKLLQASKTDTGVLAFAIWQAIEESCGRNSAKATEWLSTIAPTTQPLSRVLSHKAMRRLCDTRKAENLDLAVEFCDKIGAHDILLAHALDGLVKGQKAA